MSSGTRMPDPLVGHWRHPRRWQASTAQSAEDAAFLQRWRAQRLAGRPFAIKRYDMAGRLVAIGDRRIAPTVTTWDDDKR